jgi:phenylacetate-CoA ligase
MTNSFHMNDGNIAWYLNQLNAVRPQCIVAYTNPLYTFARSIEEQGLHPFSPRSIIVGAEKLHGFQRELIERVFRAPVFETYGSREFMLIGGECEHHNGLHITMENLLVEIVDDDGRHTPPGQEGNVVITDLTNRSMPFIRYLNGDRAIAGFEQCPCGRGLPLLKKVVGRRLDMLETPDGRRIPGEFFPHLIKDFASIRRFQVIQDESERIQVCLVVNRDWGDDDLHQLERQIRDVIGDVVQLEIAVVDHIPLTPAGKLRVVIRNFSSDGVDLLAPLGQSR